MNKCGKTFAVACAVAGQYGLERDIVVRGRAFLKQARHVFREKYCKESVKSLSPLLQAEISYASHGTWIQDISFMRLFMKKGDGSVEPRDKYGEQTRLRLAIAAGLDAQCFAQNERLIAEGEQCHNMYVYLALLLEF